MPHLHQDNSTRLNLDPELEFEADKSGMIHTRKSTSPTEFLEGYGTEHFGISPYESKSKVAPASTNLLLAAGIGSAGFLAWEFKGSINSRFQTIVNYALLLREEYRTR